MFLFWSFYFHNCFPWQSCVYCLMHLKSHCSGQRPTGPKGFLVDKRWSTLSLELLHRCILQMRKFERGADKQSYPKVLKPDMMKHQFHLTIPWSQCLTPAFLFPLKLGVRNIDMALVMPLLLRGFRVKSYGSRYSITLKQVHKPSSLEDVAIPLVWLIFRWWAS